MFAIGEEEDQVVPQGQEARYASLTIKVGTSDTGGRERQVVLSYAWMGGVGEPGILKSGRAGISGMLGANMTEAVVATS